MARIEIEEADYAALQGIHTSLKGMLNHPEARKMVLKAAKTANPAAVIPEIDAAEPVNKELTEVRGLVQSLADSFASDKRERDEAAVLSRFQTRWSEQEQTLRANGWRAAGIEQVRKFAEDNQISDLSIAADAWQARHPDPEPSAVGNSAWNMFGGGAPDKEDTFVADMMKTGGDDERRLDREIADILKDVRTANR